MKITQARLHELLNYDPETGVFTWKVNRRGTARAGTVAGTPHNAGYLTIRVDRTPYLAHRLAWVYVHGDLPDDLEVDHKNLIKTDNRIDNLRAVTHALNMINTPSRRTSTTGIKNVSFHKHTGTWRVTMPVHGKRRDIGYFRDIELAEFVAYEAREFYHGEFACHA